MKIAAHRGVGGAGDPDHAGRRRWPVCHGLGLPVASWMLRGLDADSLEALLSDDGRRRADTVGADSAIVRIVRAASGTTTPAEVLAQLQALAVERDPPRPPAPRVDRGDELAEVALGCTAGNERLSCALLGVAEARALLTWVQARVPRASWHRLAVPLAADLRLARARAVELVVDREIEAVERQERELLEAPAREAAARVQAAAAAARARIEAEIAS